MRHIMPPRPEASLLTVACRPSDFSASTIAHAVEDSNGHLLNLNVTSQTLDDGRITVELRTSLPHTLQTERSLMRYGYEVIDARDADPADSMTDDTRRRRAAELLRLIDL